MGSERRDSRSSSRAVITDSWPGGAVFVELSSATGGPSTAENVGAALGTEVIEGQAPEEAVRRRLRQTPTLIVLDDLDLAGDVLDDLLDLAGLSPETRFVATAHAPIGHAAERVMRLRPLPTAPDDLADPERLAEVPAVALYVARAVALDPDFALDDSNALAVADLTRRFDGLPLAIELGAARARIMSPTAQLAALEEHSVLDLRAPGSDARPDRHREVRTALAASYAVAGDAEKAILRHMSVFAGGCTSQRLRAVVGEADWTLAAILDALVELVDLGLVEVDADPDGEPRYRLLPTIAAYAREQLESEGEADAAESRREAVLRSAARKTRTLAGRKQVDALARDAGELQVLFARLGDGWSDRRRPRARQRPGSALVGARAVPGSGHGLRGAPGHGRAVEQGRRREDRGAGDGVVGDSRGPRALARARSRGDPTAPWPRRWNSPRRLDDPALLLFALNAVVVAVFVTGDMAGAAAATAEGLAPSRRPW